MHAHVFELLSATRQALNQISHRGKSEIVSDLPYAALSREDEMKVRGRVDRIRIRAEDALQAWCDIGHELKCLREEVPHGGFLSLVDQEFGWGKTQVNEFIQIYDHWAPKVRNSVPLEAPLSRQVAIEVARKSTPPEVQSAVEEMLVDGQKVTATGTG